MRLFDGYRYCLIAEEINVDMDCVGFTLFIEGDDITQSLL